MGQGKNLRLIGGTLTESKLTTQAESLRALSKLLNEASAGDPATIRWVALLLRRLAGFEVLQHQGDMRGPKGWGELPQGVDGDLLSGIDNRHRRVRGNLIQ